MYAQKRAVLDFLYLTRHHDLSRSNHVIVSLRPFAKAGWIEFIEQEPAVHADTQVFDDLVEEEPLLWLILRRWLRERIAI